MGFPNNVAVSKTSRRNVQVLETEEGTCEVLVGRQTKVVDDEVQRTQSLQWLMTRRIR
jgi:hypothetical protein